MFRDVALCVGLLMLYAASSQAYTKSTSGTGTGVQCGNHICAPKASCTVNNTCICNDTMYNTGNGYLKCHTSGFISAFLVNDPVISNYDKEHANLPLPCRYDFTEFKADMKDPETGDKLGLCSIHLMAFNGKNLGKFFVQGIDAAIKINFVEPSSHFDMSVRKTGFAENGVYHYQINASQDFFDVEGPFGNDIINFEDSNTGLTLVECYIDEENNIAMINISLCGVCIYFRAYDTVLKRNQEQLPGIAVGIDLNNDPNFTSANKNQVALIPKGRNSPVAFADLAPENATNSEKIVFRALGGTPVPQSNPNPNENCSTAGHILNELGSSEATLLKALEGCLWILKSPKFIKCYDTTENGQEIMALFDACVSIHKSGGYTCSEVQSLMSTCVAHDPTNTMLQKFMAGDLC